jgi:hypothetical protein
MDDVAHPSCGARFLVMDDVVFRGGRLLRNHLPRPLLGHDLGRETCRNRFLSLRFRHPLALMLIQIQNRIKLRLLRREPLSVARRQAVLAVEPLRAGGVA